MPSSTDLPGWTNRGRPLIGLMVVYHPIHDHRACICSGTNKHWLDGALTTQSVAPRYTYPYIWLSPKRNAVCDGQRSAAGQASMHRSCWPQIFSSSLDRTLVWASQSGVPPIPLGHGNALTDRRNLLVASVSEGHLNSMSRSNDWIAIACPGYLHISDSPYSRNYLLQAEKADE